MQTDSGIKAAGEHSGQSQSGHETLSETIPVPNGHRTPGLVIFDFDGVVVDSEVISLSTLRQAMKDFGVSLSLEDVRARFLGGSINRFEAYVDANGTRPAAVGFAQHWYDMLFEHFRTDLEVMPGFLELLERLDTRSIPYCVASGGSYERLGVAMEATRLSDRFKTKIFSADLVEHGKPQPDLFLHAAQKMAVAPDRCLVIEDSPAGIIAAKAAGMPVIGFVGGSHLKDVIEDYPKTLMSHRADAIIHAFGQIEDWF